MEKLMKPIEYAKMLGISRQAVYAKIKRGMLKAKEVDGKLYIVVTDEEGITDTSASNGTQASAIAPAEQVNDYEALLAAKDETIAVLKATVSDLKESHHQISTTLRGEIELLKEAFGEMRTLYKMQLEQKKRRETAKLIEVIPQAETPADIVPAPQETISIKKLCKRYGITKAKRREKIRKRIQKAWEAGDERIVKEGEKLRIVRDADVDDLIV